MPCPGGYSADTTARKTDITQCQRHCDAGSYLVNAYTQLEYLEGTGTQYIDTGANFIYGDEFFFDYMPVSSYSDEEKGYGAGGNSSSKNITGGGRRANNTKVTMYITSTNVAYSPSLTYTNTIGRRYTEHWTLRSTFNSTLTDVASGTTYTLSKNSISSSYNSGNSIYFWRDHGAEKYDAPSAARIYGAWLKRSNGTYAFNFVPARRNSDGVLGLYDTVNGTFKTNIGTGTFLAGSDVRGVAGSCQTVSGAYYAYAANVNWGADGVYSKCPNGYDYNTASGKTSINQCQARCAAGTYVPEYTPLQYVHFDGTADIGAYVNTGLSVYTDVQSNNVRLYADAILYSGSERWRAIVGTSCANGAYIGTKDNRVYACGQGFSQLYTSAPYNKRCVYDLDLPNNKFTVYDTTTSSYLINVSDLTPTAGSVDVPITIGTYIQNTNGDLVVQSQRTAMDLYSVKIYDNGNLIFDGVPMRRNSDGLIGLWDTVSQTFKTSVNGTNPLIAGPAGNPCVNVGVGYYSSASTVNYGSTGTRTACPTGLSTVGYGHGADSANDCARTLHVGDKVLYGRRDKVTEPSLNIKIENEDTYYVSLSPTNHTLSRLHVSFNGNEYTAYDDSLSYGERDFDTGEQIAQ